MKTKVLLIILLISGSLTYAQSKLADKFFENFAYVRASELYEEAVANGDDSEHVLTRLGDCYYNNSNAAKAATWYKKALDKYSDIHPEYIYKYSQVQRSLGNYQEAEDYLQKFKERQNEDSRTKFILGDVKIYDELSSMEKVYIEVTNLDINTEYSDFGSFEYDGNLYFASARNTSNKLYDWNEEPFLDIYQVDVKDDNGVKALGKPGFIMAEDVNTNYHEASVAITNDGKTIYFTRDNVNKRNRLDYDKKGTTHLKIYKASLDNGNWSDIEELPFNDDVFSTGHPALSPDNKTLYFVSDRDDINSFGQTDIYKVTINDDGSYGEPENLGAAVNTEGREMFPFVAKDNTLYFSSDGYLNLGLLDIYKSDALNGSTDKPKNLGAPYNSGADDFAFYITENETGYFSSNREGGKGSDDIYSFAAYECKQTVTGVARDSKTQEPLNAVTIEIINDAGVIIQTVTTAADGAYTYEVDCNQKYSIRGSKPNYKDDVQHFIAGSENNFENKVDLNLIPLCFDSEIVINPIFFDFDKWNIRTDAQYELENIVSVMRDHPQMVIKIESHTDSRGRDAYNIKLSDRRAKSTRDYLLSRNIAPERIESAIGYGETQLLNECSNGVKCSKEKHQKNRRSKFLIVQGKCEN
ncbi:OmpA family protein [Flavobacteriaceae bacterium S0825]|uniref:OmpA family protein n=1 Tax=Gaetbulibacter sp. S0825 TaxID=2720084 RepID=UPI0014310713|nr:OmpA family protein [Gaetbulibacter sp. S0825]MCK0109850.1 OmpA family protein [Flavobacteriaceae bacterium S0825]NIX65479.1 OmpA family protein [Gaetbulibacter sp. S0825]